MKKAPIIRGSGKSEDGGEDKGGDSKTPNNDKNTPQSQGAGAGTEEAKDTKQTEEDAEKTSAKEIDGSTQDAQLTSHVPVPPKGTSRLANRRKNVSSIQIITNLAQLQKFSAPHPNPLDGGPR